MAKKPEELGFLGLETSTYGNEIPKFVEKTGWEGFKEKAGNILKRIRGLGKSSEQPKKKEETEEKTLEETREESGVENEEKAQGTEKSTETISVDIEQKQKELEEKINELTKRRDELEAQIAKVDELLGRIKQILGKTDQKIESNGTEKTEIAKEFSGAEAVSESFKKIPDSVLSGTAKSGFGEKFKSGKANPAEAVVALGALENIKTDGLTEADKSILQNSRDFLNQIAGENNEWKQPEGKISDWVEAQAILSGDTKALDLVAQLREVNSPTDKSKVNSALLAIDGLREDRTLRATMSLSESSRLNDILTSVEEQLKQKQAKN